MVRWGKPIKGKGKTPKPRSIYVELTTKTYFFKHESQSSNFFMDCRKVFMANILPTELHMELSLWKSLQLLFESIYFYLCKPRSCFQIINKRARKNSLNDLHPIILIYAFQILRSPS